MKHSKGQGNGTNPVAADIQKLQQRIQKELEDIEKNIYEQETIYLRDTQAYGNVFKGWDGVANPNKNQFLSQAHRKQPRFSQQDRLFSYSSATAPHQDEESKGALYDANALKQKKMSLTLGKSGKQFDNRQPSKQKQSLNITKLNKKKNRQTKRAQDAFKKNPGIMLDEGDQGMINEELGDMHLFDQDSDILSNNDDASEY